MATTTITKEDPTGVLVTGASTGIGRVTAEYLSSHGYWVFAGARKRHDMEALDKITNITAIQLDVCNIATITAAVDQIMLSKIPLVGLVNNAGIARAGPLMELPEQELQDQFDVNVLGVHRVTRACFPLLRQTNGRIVMMSSDSGFFATPFFGPYCMSKFALEGYSDSLRRELLLCGMKVILIQPGRVATPIWEKGKRILKQFGTGQQNLSELAHVGRKVGEYAIHKGLTAGLPPVAVAKVVYEALTTKKPKLRYLVAEHKLKYRLIKVLPASRVDHMVEKELKQLLMNCPDHP
jgi:short-subunit dehydrogenase